jgi:hypothetical protein
VTGPGRGPRTTIRLDERNDAVRLHVVGGQSYVPQHLPGMPGPPDPNSERETWPEAYRAMSDRDVRRARRNWLRSMNEFQERSGRFREGHEVVRDEAEIVRAEGNLTAQRLSAGTIGLSAAAGQPIPLRAQVGVPGATSRVGIPEMHYGRMAPMAAASSSGIGSRAEVQAALDIRHGSYAVILNTLRRAVRQHPDAVVMLPGRIGEAMRDVTMAYERWLAASRNEGTPAPQVNAFATQLQTALERFLAAIGDG